MARETAWSWFDAGLSKKGELSVGPKGEVLIELGDERLGGLVPSDAVELAEAIIERAKPTHRLVETEVLADAVERLKELLEDE